MWTFNWEYKQNLTFKINSWEGGFNQHRSQEENGGGGAVDSKPLLPARHRGTPFSPLSLHLIFPEIRIDI